MKIYHPTVWDAKGRELFPAPGRIIPKGSLTRGPNGEFIELEESIWILEAEEDDMGKRLTPHYKIIRHERQS